MGRINNMSKWQVYITDNNGEGVAQELQVWDDNEILELRLAAFANDAVISIEPFKELES
jgi:hypothetical protein